MIGVGAIANGALIFFAFVLSLPALSLQKTRGWLKLYGWAVLVSAIVTLAIGLAIWFSTLKTRSNLRTFWAEESPAVQSLLQQRVSLIDESRGRGRSDVRTDGDSSLAAVTSMPPRRLFSRTLPARTPWSRRRCPVAWDPSPPMPVNISIASSVSSLASLVGTLLFSFDHGTMPLT